MTRLRLLPDSDRPTTFYVEARDHELLIYHGDFPEEPITIQICFVGFTAILKEVGREVDVIPQLDQKRVMIEVRNMKDITDNPVTLYVASDEFYKLVMPNGNTAVVLD